MEVNNNPLVPVSVSLPNFHIRSFLVHSATEYRPIEFPVSYLLQNLDQ